MADTILTGAKKPLQEGEVPLGLAVDINEIHPNAHRFSWGPKGVASSIATSVDDAFKRISVTVRDSCPITYHGENAHVVWVEPSVGTSLYALIVRTSNFDLPPGQRAVATLEGVGQKVHAFEHDYIIFKRFEVTNRLDAVVDGVPVVYTNTLPIGGFRN